MIVYSFKKNKLIVHKPYTINYKLKLNTPLVLNKFLATGVGSLPHTNPQEACELVIKYLGQDIPFWPQLPKKNFKENMYVQYSQGLPGVVVDEYKQHIYIDTAKDGYVKELESAYEHYLADDLEYFAISQDYAAGLYEFLSILGRWPRQRRGWRDRRYIKGHTIGPISFGLSVTDQNKKASIYNQEFCECLVKVLAIKVRWQIRKLQDAFPGAHIIIFIDEPYLVSVGSSFFNIKIEDVINMLNELIEAIHREGAFSGIHCCGNTDWGMVLKTNIDILNFDGCNYLETIFIYRQDLDNFLKKYGVLAWGIIPNNAEGALPNIDTLREKINKSTPYGKSLGIITPSCGLSATSPERAEEILKLTVLLSENLITA